MTTADDKRLQGQVNAANNAGAGEPDVASPLACRDGEHDEWCPRNGCRCGKCPCWSESDEPSVAVVRPVPCSLPQAVPTVEVHCAEHGGPLGDAGCVECGQDLLRQPLPFDLIKAEPVDMSPGSFMEVLHQADVTPPDMHSEECVQHRTRGFATCICTPPDTPPDTRSEETLTPLINRTGQVRNLSKSAKRWNKGRRSRG